MNPEHDDELTPHTSIHPVALSQDERVAIFGAFPWTPAPTLANPEAIAILGDWQARNILTIATPQLASIGISHVRFHRLAIKQFAGLLSAWSKAGLIHHVATWDGSFVPRLKRGKAGSANFADLSNHSWGTAFDINARWNRLGANPAPLGTIGSVRELVLLARQFGFFWGGDFRTRVDGMHFEICKTIQ